MKRKRNQPFIYTYFNNRYLKEMKKKQITIRIKKVITAIVNLQNKRKQNN